MEEIEKPWCAITYRDRKTTIKVPDLKLRFSRTTVTFDGKKEMPPWELVERLTTLSIEIESTILKLKAFYEAARPLNQIEVTWKSQR